jgi:hypothetical protein
LGKLGEEEEEGEERGGGEEDKKIRLRGRERETDFFLLSTLALFSFSLPRAIFPLSLLCAFF